MTLNYGYCCLSVFTDIVVEFWNMKLKDPPADMDVPQEIEIRLSNIDSEKMGMYYTYGYG